MIKFANKIIKILITSDFILNLGWGLVSPIFAIFIVENITSKGPLEAAKIAGFASLFYWITKSILQVPIGRYLDKNHGEKDDFWFMVIGTFLAALVPIGYLFSFLPWHIYLLQILHAVAMSMAFPSWLAIFTRHIDKGREAFEWSMESTFLSAGAGIAGGLGGVLVGIFGFNAVFIIVTVLDIVSAVLLIFIKKDLSLINKDTPRMVPARPFVEP
ncbi:MAG: MFS transporter [Patescibacteria group bacterium]